jgi:hypothetical protein
MRFTRLLSLTPAAALLALTPHRAAAQAMTTITATNVQAGNVAATGTLCMRAVDVRGNPISVSKAGGGFYLAGQPFCQTVTAGALAGSLTVPNPVTDSAPGHAYDIQVYDTLSGMLIDLGPIYGIGGSTWSLDNYNPTVTVPTTAAFTFTQGSGVPSGSCTAPALYVNNSTGQISVCVASAWENAAGGSGITQLTGDVTTPSGSGTQPATLATVNSSPGACGDATHVCQVTTNAKGLTTAQTQVAISAGGATLGTSAQGGTIPVSEYANAAHPPLAYWDAALHTCQAGASSQIIRVQVHGDSRSIVDTTVTSGVTGISVTFPGRWEQRLKTQLQSMCGSHGSGIVPFRHTTSSFASPGSFNADFYTVTGTYVATDLALGPYQPDTSDPMLVTATSNGATVNFSVADAFDHLLVYGVNKSGVHPWTLYIDGVSVGTCGSASGSEAATVCTSSAVTLGTHTASIVCATQPCEAYAMEAAAGSTGVSVDNFSVGSASAEMFGQYPSTQFAFSDLAPGGVALDIIEEIANEPGHSESTGTFTTTLGNIITHDRALTYPPSILITAPLQDGIGGQSSYYPILASVASASSTAYLDLRDRWGSSLVSWLFGSDTYHENNIGNGEYLSAIEQTIIDVPSAGAPTASCLSGFSLQSYGPGGFTCQANTTTSGPVGCGAAFSHHAALTVASSSVSGGADLANYPALVGFNGATQNSIALTNLKTVANGGQVQSSTGLDIIFCSASNGGTQLNHELVAGTYTPTTGAAEFYVDVPTVSHTTGTSIYVFWDDSSATDTSAKSAVWSAASYAAVYHGGGASLDLTDSTANANNLTNNGATATAGAFGNAFNVTGSYLIDASPTGVPSGSSQRTVEGWVYYPSSVSGDSVPFSYGSMASSGTAFAVDFTGSNLYAWDNGDVWIYPTTITTGAWHLFAATVPSGTGALDTVVTYLDGAPRSSPTCAVGSCTAALATAAANLEINGLPSSGGGAGITGYVDEVRFSSVARTAGWIATQYSNQSNPSTFWALGTIY